MNKYKESEKKESDIHTQKMLMRKEKRIYKDEKECDSDIKIQRKKLTYIDNIQH